MKPLKICVIGAGQFSQCFIPLYQAHPKVAEVSIAEIDPERRKKAAQVFNIEKTFATFEEAISSDIDAVAIFSQRWSHAPMALAAMAAGKHVYSAVPAGTTLEDLERLIESVKKTGLTYMMGETSCYYGSHLFMKEKWQSGAFGRFVYGEGEYYHDMSHGFYEAFSFSGGDQWQATASFPPMLYPTHSVSMVLGVTGARAVKVSCLGIEDQHEDGIFYQDLSRWQNTFSNQSALFQTSDGGVLRVNEFRRIGQSGGRSVRGRMYGTEGAFEEQTNGGLWTSRAMWGSENIESQIVCGGVHTHEQWQAVEVDAKLKGDFTTGFSEIQQKYRQRLPESYQLMPNGHEGSHQFLTDDFVTAVVKGSLPTVSVYDAARYNAPGIVAHESSKRGGEQMTIPDFGSPKT